MIPHFSSEKYKEQAIFTAADMLALRSRKGEYPKYLPPKGVIFCYQRDFMENYAKKHHSKKVGGFFGDLYMLDETQGQIGIVGNFGVGAPVVVVLLSI